MEDLPEVREEEKIEKITDNTPFTNALEESGTIDLLADTLIALYTNPKTPPEIFNFFLNTIGASEHPDVEKLLTENQELRKSIISLKSQIAELEAKARK